MVNYEKVASRVEKVKISIKTAMQTWLNVIARNWRVAIFAVRDWNDHDLMQPAYKYLC